MEGLVRFSYKRFIDANASQAWDKSVFENSYLEFRIQFQNYPESVENTDFGQFISKINSDEFQAKVSRSVVGNLQLLDGIVPQISDAYGQLFLEFKKFKFEIIDTDFENKNRHKIAIEFVTEPLLLLGKIGNDYLIALPSELEKFQTKQEILTRLLPSQPSLNIYSFQKI